MADTKQLILTTAYEQGGQNQSTNSNSNNSATDSQNINDTGRKGGLSRDQQYDPSEDMEEYEE